MTNEQQEDQMPKGNQKLPKVRNPEARALSDPLFRQRIVPSRKAYKRRDRNQKREED